MLRLGFVVVAAKNCACVSEARCELPALRSSSTSSSSQEEEQQAAATHLTCAAGEAPLKRALPRSRVLTRPESVAAVYDCEAWTLLSTSMAAWRAVHAGCHDSGSALAAFLDAASD